MWVRFIFARRHLAAQLLDVHVLGPKAMAFSE
jgi:hypothetical protein